MIFLCEHIYRAKGMHAHMHTHAPSLYTNKRIITRKWVMLKHKHSHYCVWSRAQQETVWLWSSGLQQNPAGYRSQGQKSEYF